MQADDLRGYRAPEIIPPPRRRRRWSRWLAVAVILAVLGLVAVLIATGGDGEDVDVADDRTAEGGDAPDAGGDRGTSSTATTDGGGDRGTGTSPAASSTLTAGDVSLLPVPADGLAPLVGAEVTGRNVEVQSVVGDEAFWVGDGEENRLLVVLSEEARGTGGESPFEVVAGQRIDLTGEVVTLGGPPSDLGLDSDEGSDTLVEQGGYVVATSIDIATDD
jgi:hypothetical protein